MGDEVKDIELAQSFLRNWQHLTCKPMTTREIEFAKAIRNEAIEEAAQMAELSHPKDWAFIGVEIRKLKEPK